MAYDREIHQKYWRSRKGWLTKVYAQQRSNSKKRGHSLPTYSKEELRMWLAKEPMKTIFEELYSEWVESDYQKEFTPSLDRLDNDKGYSLDNIQIVTWEQNRINYNQKSIRYITAGPIIRR